MKKILSLILFALLFLPLEGQGILRANPFYSASKRTYATVLNDGDTWAWYKADADNITTDGQDSVTVWNNALGDAKDLYTVLLPSKAKPVFHGDSVIFDGTNSTIFYSSDVLAQPLTIYMVLNQLAAPLGWEDENMILGGNSYLKQNGSSPQITAYAGSSGSTIAGPAIGTRGLVTLILDGDNGYLQTNDDTPAADATYGTNALTGLVLGNNATISPSASASNISVSEIIIRSAHDTEGDMALIKAYLQNKYGL